MREPPLEIELCVRLLDGHVCLGQLHYNLAGWYCFKCSATQPGAIYRLVSRPEGA
jgi:hypothetical protein